jgi:hypothetical protein
VIRRLGIVFWATVAVALGAAAPAGAVQIGIRDADDGPIPPGVNHAVQVLAAPGESNDVSVTATDPARSAYDFDPPTTIWARTVTVTDKNATFDTAQPWNADLPCEIVDAHTATCSAPAGTQFTQAIVDLGDGDNRLQFAADTVPLREELSTGDGTDTISTGPFAGDASPTFGSTTGGGNDTVTIGPPVVAGFPRDAYPPYWGLALWTGAGNDTVHAVNGGKDIVNCGDGADTLYAEPWDDDLDAAKTDIPCETRVPPAG